MRLTRLSHSSTGAKGFRSVGVALALVVTAGGTKAQAVGLRFELDGSAQAGGPAAAAAESGGTPDASADEGTTGSTSDADPREANPAHYDIAFVSMGAYQAWSIAGRWLYIGIGGGVGPPLYRYSKFSGKSADWDPSLEIVYGNGFVRLAPVRYVDLDVGPKIAILSALYDAGDTPRSGFSYGGYVDLRVGSKTIKLGPRFELGRVAYSDARTDGWRFTPIMLRITH